MILVLVVLLCLVSSAGVFVLHWFCVFLLILALVLCLGLGLFLGCDPRWCLCLDFCCGGLLSFISDETHKGDIRIGLSFNQLEFYFFSYIVLQLGDQDMHLDKHSPFSRWLVTLLFSILFYWLIPQCSTFQASRIKEEDLDASIIASFDSVINSWSKLHPEWNHFTIDSGESQMCSDSFHLFFSNRTIQHIVWYIERFYQLSKSELILMTQSHVEIP